MLQAPEAACLVIADISGYTTYLVGTELDHAQDILADLIGTVVGALRPTFRLAKLEGDAAFAYALTETVDASILQDTVERTYFAFRRRLRDIARASSCECNACIRIPSLDLKVVAHHGPVVRQRIAGRDELAGPAVIVAHRLLKNDVPAVLGLPAYALYSDDVVAAMAIEDPTSAGLREYRATYEGVGEVGGWVRDLEAAWQAELARSRVIVEPESALWSMASTYDGPPSIAWEWVTSPVRRPRWQQDVTAIEEASTSGRRGVGTTNHCMHGKDAIVEEVLDWQPFDYLTVRSRMPMPGVPPMVISYLFEPVDDRTRVTFRLQRPRSAKDRAVLEQLGPMLEPAVRAGASALEPLIAADVAARRAAAGTLAEPELPPAVGRGPRSGPDGPASAVRPPGVDAGPDRSS